MSRLDDFLADVVSSRLVARDDLRQARDEFGPTTDDDAGVRFARQLVDRGLLTNYQARKLLAGATRGFLLGDYVILDRIGEGGMGKVYKARRRSDGATVALKVLPPQKIQEHAIALDRFRREMDLSRLVRHKYVARTLDAGVEDGIHYMVMEYVPGQTLYHLVKDPRRGVLRVPDAARLFIKVADGLAAAHDVELVHRDIKPSNIMVTPEGDARILDLGLARTTEEEGELTKANTIIGTLDYASPEQLGNAAKADARSDLYSIGCTLYFALTGRPPFEGGDLINKMYKHRMEDPEPMERLAKGIPAAFAAIVRKLMAKEPEDRYQDARELARDLSRWTDPATTRALIGADAESARAFRPPAPQLDERDLKFFDTGSGSSSLDIRDLGEDRAKPAPRQKPPVEPRPALLIQGPIPEPNDSNRWISRVLIVAVILGALGILAIAFLL